MGCSQGLQKGRPGCTSTHRLKWTLQLRGSYLHTLPPLFLWGHVHLKEIFRVSIDERGFPTSHLKGVPGHDTGPLDTDPVPLRRTSERPGFKGNTVTETKFPSGAGVVPPSPRTQVSTRRVEYVEGETVSTPRRTTPFVIPLWGRECVISFKET